MKRKAMLSAMVCVVLMGGTLAKGAENPKAFDGTELNDLEAAFAREMTGAVLSGTFTLDEKGKEGRLITEKYTISKVAKMTGPSWVITARIAYGSKDVLVPVPVQVNWAGDTPVVMLTDMNIPKLGTYTARVLFYRGHYAGTWSGGDHGGKMFGTVTGGGDKSVEGQGKEK